MANVLDLPLWEDFPFRASLPSWVTVRSGVDSLGRPVVAFHDPECMYHVTIPGAGLDGLSYGLAFKPAIDVLEWHVNQGSNR